MEDQAAPLILAGGGFHPGDCGILGGSVGWRGHSWFLLLGSVYVLYGLGARYIRFSGKYVAPAYRAIVSLEFHGFLTWASEHSGIPSTANFGKL